MTTKTMMIMTTIKHGPAINPIRAAFLFQMWFMRVVFEGSLSVKVSFNAKVRVSAMVSSMVSAMVSAKVSFKAKALFDAFSRVSFDVKLLNDDVNDDNGIDNVDDGESFSDLWLVSNAVDDVDVSDNVDDNENDNDNDDNLDDDNLDDDKDNERDVDVDTRVGVGAKNIGVEMVSFNFLDRLMTSLGLREEVPAGVICDDGSNGSPLVQ